MSIFVQFCHFFAEKRKQIGPLLPTFSTCVHKSLSNCKIDIMKSSESYWLVLSSAAIGAMHAADLPPLKLSPQES